MLKYCEILDENSGLVQLGAGCPDEYYIEIGMKKRDVEQSDIDYQWYLSEKCPHKSEEEKEQEEKERIQRLSMTKLDFVKAVAAYNVTYEAIKVLLSQSPDAQMEWECCERVYRFNALLEPMAGQFGITPEQLDIIFKERGQ